ncbi:hypothetical protein HELRODRAFT_178140 [Helobdella robusta]|uniref:C-type lectin domain-containing protein n=1 Tax=Helobdella robusta TaxID=6412 RepID=T1FCT8_HELRO|nr:hypothetical protein HELRODRAFT_178140 [Helobdella robusta]ESN97354.1 hypothetical protein HELRODRAFT_178140 [Helobdella robusta]
MAAKHTSIMVVNENLYNIKFTIEFVWHYDAVFHSYKADCPSGFDYIAEYHKCYKLASHAMNWYDGRSFCNNILSSRLIMVEDAVENTIASEYVNHVSPSLFLVAIFNSFKLLICRQDY